jgi:hypothetical protein
VSAAAEAAVGLLFGGGLALAVTRLPMLRRPSLDDRLAPYLRDTARPSRLLASRRIVTPFPTVEHPWAAAHSMAVVATLWSVDR